MTKTAKPDIPEIGITVQSDLWPDMGARIEKAALATLAHSGRSGEVSIVLANDALLRELNKTYRDKDKPTNVLSFPQDHPETLGDIVLAFETIEREAQEQNKSFEDHVTHLVVHGILHLLGLDHETPQDAAEMEGLEIKILVSLGVKNPYEI